MFRILIFLFLVFSFTSPVLAVRTDVDAPITKKVLILEINPLLSSGKRLSEQKGWGNPAIVEQSSISNIREVSGGYLNYMIVQRIVEDEFPIKEDGFRYSETMYFTCLSNTQTCHRPDTIDWYRFFNQYDICGKRNRGDIDELWIWAAPYFGVYETRLAGPGAFFYNSPPLQNTTCQKLLPIDGFNYERPEEVLHNIGHRTESVMKYIYGSWEQAETHAWNRFSLLNALTPGRAGCGNIHYAPNMVPPNEGNYSSTQVAPSMCNDWFNYPTLTGTIEQIGCQAWGCTKEGYYKWWFSHLPRYKGIGPDGKLLNWWHYVSDYDDAKEMERVMNESVAPKGYHDGALPDVQCAVHGWTCDQDDFSNPLSVRFYEGSALVGETVSNVNREQAVGDLCGGHLNRGFWYEFPMDNTIRDGGTHTITAKAMDIDRLGRETMRPFDLATNPQVITCPARPTPTATPTHTPVPTHTLAPLAGDETGDRKVNIADLLILLRNNTTSLIFRYGTVVAQYGRLQ